MLKQRMIKVMAVLTLLAMIAGSTSIVADTLGLSLTPQAHAEDCASGGGSC
jgi:hypothetical protein